MSKKSEKIHLKPEVLRSLRENSGYGISELAKKIGVNPEKIERVERGKDDFTIRQVKKLAEIYKVPLAAFFSDVVPRLPSLPDYRINREKRIPPSVNFAIRRAKYLSDMVYEISRRRTIFPEFPRNLPPKELAEKLRDYLNPVAPKRVYPSRILNYYKKLIEEKLNVLVVEYPLKSEDVRAFIIKNHLSVIVLNESDEAPIKLFSLFHELGHLLRDEVGLCSITMEEDAHVERYCNRFAAEFLMPEKEFKEHVEKYGTNMDGLKKMQRVFGVSIQAMMIRLLNLDLISQEEYEDFKMGFSKKERTGGGGKNWEVTYKNRVGYLAIEEVRKAYKKGELCLHESMEILDMKMKYIENVLK